MKFITVVAFFLIGYLGILNETYGASTASEKKITISQNDILDLMNEALARPDSTKTDFAAKRHPLQGLANRAGMKEFIGFKMSQLIGKAGGQDKGHSFVQQTFSTRIHSSNHEVKAVDGTNLIAVLKGSKPEASDEPLMIVANYDTDANTRNPVAENGAGVAALLVLGKYIAEELQSGAYTLENTLIFAATDLSFRKYLAHSEGSIINATTGSDKLAQEFLPTFLNGRKFRGAIVLDSILNYQKGPNTEVSAQSFSKAYPGAYQIMSNNQFTGNFLALVARPDDLDKTLKMQIEEGWEKALKQPREDVAEESHIEPQLISFVHTAHDETAESFMYFLQSDQFSFWNHHVRNIYPAYPAILLTDTREKYRSPICTSCSRIEDSTTPDNLAFSHRTILTLYNVVKELQTSDGSGSSGLIKSSGIAIITPMIALILRYFLAMNL